MKPLISIIIPAFNAEKYLQETIESVLRQTYKNIEILVVDDGSQDKTSDIARSFGDHIALINQENKGLPAARNAGIRASHGEYLAFLDADDTYFPEKIERQVNFLQAHSEFSIAYCHMYHYYEGHPQTLYRHQWPCPSGDVFGELFNGFFGQADTLLVPRYVFDKVGYFDEDFKFAEDWEMNLRMAHAGYTFGFMNEPLIKMRITEGSWGGVGNQIGNKSYEVKIFEKVSGYLSDEEKAQYPVRKSLMNAKMRLAAAYLTQGKKPEALAELRSIRYGTAKQAAVWLIICGVSAVPASFLAVLAKRLVLKKRKGILKRTN